MKVFLVFFISLLMPFLSFSNTTKKFEITTEITNSETSEITKTKTIVTDNEPALLNIKNDAESDIETIIEVSASDFKPESNNEDITAKFNIKEVTNGDLSYDAFTNMVVAPNKSATMTLYLKGKSMTLNVKAKRLDSTEF